MLILNICMCSWHLHHPSTTTQHIYTSDRSYREFCSAKLDSTTTCQRICSTLERGDRWNLLINVMCFGLVYSCLQDFNFTCSHFSDIGRGYSVSLPASSSSYQVTGLRLGRQYRFSVQPTFENGLGTESSVDEHTGNTSTLIFWCT